MSLLIARTLVAPDFPRWRLARLSPPAARRGGVHETTGNCAARHDRDCGKVEAWRDADERGDPLRPTSEVSRAASRRPQEPEGLEAEHARLEKLVAERVLAPFAINAPLHQETR